MREMKASGIEWIEDIPIHWEVHPLYYYFAERKNKNTLGAEQNLLSLSYGRIVKKDIDTVGGLLPRNYNGYNIIEKDDIVIRPTDLQNDKHSLRTGLATEHGMVTSAYITLKPIKECDTRYFHYLLHTFDVMKVFYNMGNGVRQGLSYDEFSKLIVFSPPKCEQQKIATYIDIRCNEIDEVYSKIQQEIDRILNYKQSIISEAVTNGLNKQAEMRESGVKWVSHLPVHWPVIPSKYLFWDSDLRKQKNDIQLTASQKYGIISQEEYMERENAKVVLANQGLEDWKHVEPNDFVISLRSFQGGLEMSEVTGCITWHYVVLKAVKPIFPRFYKWLFKSSMYITALQQTCNFIRDGQDLRYSNFSQVPLYEPPIEEQKAIADYLDAKCAEIDAIIAAKQEQLATLEAYKKSLIFEYVTGKKEVV